MGLDDPGPPDYLLVGGGPLGRKPTTPAAIRSNEDVAHMRWIGAAPTHTGPCRRSAKLGQIRAGRLQHFGEQGPVERGALSPDMRRVDVEQAIQSHLARSLLTVPWPASHIHEHPVGPGAGRLAGEQQTGKPRTPTTDDEHRPIFALCRSSSKGTVVHTTSPGSARP